MNKIHDIDPQQLALQHCIKGESGCSWYHGNWHLLKSLGVVSTSAVHENTISHLLQLALAGKTAPRILLTGSTDETLVRLVHNTCSDLGIQEKLFAVDICATPLMFMQAYAKENQIELVTYHCDVLKFEAEKNFDIILTHAFMGYFDATQRPLLMEKWHQLLSDSGKIITIQRVRPADSSALVKFSAAQASTFVDSAIDAAKSSGLTTQTEIDSIKSAATEFANRFVSHAITSKSALESLFTNAELVFDLLEYHRLERKGVLSGPSVPSNAEFAHIIAGKTPGTSCQLKN
jgi:hypothetical protein